MPDDPRGLEEHGEDVPDAGLEAQAGELLVEGAGLKQEAPKARRRAL